MEARPVPHPSADSLRAFGLGQMDDTAAQALMGHLDDCPECRRAVAALSGDDFLARFRQAHGRSGTPVPARSLAEVDNPAAPTGGTLPTCHTPVANVPPQLAGHPDYEVLRELGRGGMGVVYLARNKPMDRLEVLKVVNKTLLEHPGAIERFQQEIRSAAKLSHANIVTAYSVLHQGDLLAFAMEYIPGQDLAALVKARGPLPIPYACYYVQQAAFGLQHAFEKGMVHRDIKPQNLMLARDGPRHILKVLDFGLAKATREQGEKTDLTGEGRMLGTPDFMAPEQTVDAARADIRADVYSLGCTLYYLLSGGPPFTGKTLYAILQAHHSVEARALNLVRAEVPEGLAAVVRKMMAKEPAQRYQRPIEVVQALAPFVRQSPKSAPPPLPPSLSAGAAGQAERPSAVPQAPSLPWDTLTAGGGTPPNARKIGASRTPQPAAGWRKWWLGGGIGAGLLLLALLVLWASGVFTVKTKDGTIVLENVPDGAEVLVDGATVQVKAGDGKIITITIPPGKKHWLEVKKEGFKVFGEAVEIDAGERRPIRVHLQPRSEARKTPPSAPERAVEGKGFVPLFNGKDLTGWKTRPQFEGDWRVEKGVLIESSLDFSVLSTERDDYRDFHLRAETRVSDRHYGQVIVRERYAIILNSTNGNHSRTGSLSIPGKGSVVQVSETPIRPDQWFTLEVIAEGNRVLVKVNGKTTADYSDPERAFTRGHITLTAVNQIRERQRRLEFRKIEIKELPANTDKPPSTSAARRWRASVVKGVWKIDNGDLVQTSRETGPMLLFGDPDLANYDFSFRAKTEEGSDGFKAIFHYTASSAFYIFAAGNYGNKAHDLSFVHDGRWGRKGGMYVPGRIALNRWYDVRLEIRGKEYRCFLDGKEVFSGEDERFTKGRIGFHTWGSVSRFRDIRVATPKGKVLWEGLPKLP